MTQQARNGAWAAIALLGVLGCGGSSELFSPPYRPDGQAASADAAAPGPDAPSADAAPTTDSALPVDRVPLDTGALQIPTDGGPRLSFDPSMLDKPYAGIDATNEACTPLVLTGPLVRREFPTDPLPDATAFTGGPMVDGLYDLVAQKLYKGSAGVPPFFARTLRLSGGGHRWEHVELLGDSTAYHQTKGAMDVVVTGSLLMTQAGCGLSGLATFDYVADGQTLRTRQAEGRVVSIYVRR